ncbi:hypothetical protein BU23DRAFT_451651, partial [Bimuria novae-zelandiae CBS 107.79]
IAIKALNNIASLNSFILTLLIFSTYLRINRDLSPSPDITVRAQAIQKAIKTLQNK